MSQSVQELGLVHPTLSHMSCSPPPGVHHTCDMVTVDLCGGGPGGEGGCASCDGCDGQYGKDGGGAFENSYVLNAPRLLFKMHDS